MVAIGLFYISVYYIASITTSARSGYVYVEATVSSLASGTYLGRLP